MSIYKQAAQAQLRFSTSRGNLTVEQLFMLTQSDLTNCIRAVKKTLKKTDDDELSFLDVTSKVDATEQLRFDILKDVYLSNKEQLDKLRNEKATKEHNQRILSLIADKKDQDLANKSVEELEALLKD